jgi:hypothetical protein
MSRQEHVINADGTTANVWFEDDSQTHDSDYFTYTVFLKFNDHNLNPPYTDGWIVGEIAENFREFKPEMAWNLVRNSMIF